MRITFMVLFLTIVAFFTTVGQTKSDPLKNPVKVTTTDISKLWLDKSVNFWKMKYDSLNKIVRQPMFGNNLLNIDSMDVNTFSDSVGQSYKRLVVLNVDHNYVMSDGTFLVSVPPGLLNSERLELLKQHIQVWSVMSDILKSQGRLFEAQINLLNTINNTK